MSTDLFQAIHSPIGANAGFAMGLAGFGGGFCLQSDRIPDQDIFIGYKEGNTLSMLPFYEKSISSEKDSFAKDENGSELQEHAFTEEEVSRSFVPQLQSRSHLWRSHHSALPRTSGLKTACPSYCQCQRSPGSPAPHPCCPHRILPRWREALLTLPPVPLLFPHQKALSPGSSGKMKVSLPGTCQSQARSLC